MTTEVTHVGGTARRDAAAGTGSHGGRCHCGRWARWHVMYGSGCGHVCGYHKRRLAAIHRGMTATPLA
jgi:hypothetical protein